MPNSNLKMNFGGIREGDKYFHEGGGSLAVGKAMRVTGALAHDTSIGK